MKVNLIAAIDSSLGIAKQGKIPWDLPSDRKYFRDHVDGGPVAMGWNTFVSNGMKPYGKGKNYVLTREDKNVEGVELIHSPKEFFNNLNADIWVAGGGQAFKEALPYATHLYLTRVEGDFNCDVFFPEFEDIFELSEEQPSLIENGIGFRYQVWRVKNEA